jgi:capsid protein
MERPDIASIVKNQNAFERALGVIAPSWATQRLRSRIEKHLFEYQAAQANRLFTPRTSEVPAESSRTTRERRVMMFEARDLIANFSALAGVPEKFALNCTPNEWSPATGDREYDKTIAEYFHAWCKKADVTGRHSFRQLVGMALQMRPVDGDCGFAIRKTTDGIRLQLVPADLIGNPNEISTFDQYIDGIVVDEFGKPTAYRVFQRERNGAYVNPEDVSARAFCHYFDPFRADQYRGVTEFHAVINTARMLKGILDAEQVGVRFASQQAALVFNERGSASPRQAFSAAPSITLENGQQRKDELSDVGMIKYFNTSDKVEVMPSRPSSAFTGFVEHLMDEIAMGLGIPGGVLFGTQGYKGPNVRAEFAQADRVWDRHRGVLSDKVLDPIKNDVLLIAIAEGDIPAPPAKEGETAVQALRRALRGEWRWPARMSIDVGRESTANLNENRQGIKSGQQIAAENGYDYEATLEQLAIEAAKVSELAAQYGVPETAIRLTTSSLPSTPAAAAAAGENVGASATAATGGTGIDTSGLPIGQSVNGVETFPDVSAQIAPLNGAQIAAVISIVERIRAGDLTAEAASLLMISAGMTKEAAQTVASSVAGMPKLAPKLARDSALRWFSAQKRIKLQVDTQPTQEMAAEAERGLAWRDEFNRGGTEVGVARARDIVNRRNLSPDTISRMVSYFARHEVDKQGQGWSQDQDGYPSAGRIAWALWGGDAGRAWAERKQAELTRDSSLSDLLDPRSARAARASRLAAKVEKTANLRTALGEQAATAERINAAFSRLAK